MTELYKFKSQQNKFFITLMAQAPSCMQTSLGSRKTGYIAMARVELSLSIIHNYSNAYTYQLK